MRARVFLALGKQHAPSAAAEVFVNIWDTAPPCDGEHMGTLTFDTVTWCSVPT